MLNHSPVVYVLFSIKNLHSLKNMHLKLDLVYVLNFSIVEGLSAEEVETH